MVQFIFFGAPRCSPPPRFVNRALYEAGNVALRDVNAPAYLFCCVRNVRSYFVDLRATEHGSVPGGRLYLVHIIPRFETDPSRGVNGASRQSAGCISRASNR